MKPWATMEARGRRAVMVDRPGRKPCWWGEQGMEGSRRGRTRRSRTLEAGQRREIGRKEVLRVRGLPGLGTGRIRACFQMAGRLAWARERLKRWVRKEIALGPRCLR